MRSHLTTFIFLKVYFALGLILGDNKGVNDMCGFSKSFRAHYFCRFCRMHSKQTKTATTQIDKLMRNKKNYFEDLKKNNYRFTGVYEESIVNSFYLSHATNSIGVDNMHDILEGILHYNMCEIILHYIRKKTFSLDKLNQLKSDLSYGELESGNKSPPIEMKRLTKKKLTMSASEMGTFARHFGFMVGDLVTKSDKQWQFYLKTMKFVDLVDLKAYTENDLKDLTTTISDMNQMYVTLFKQTLKAKHHIITHYPTLITLYGPLRFLTSMRFEAKHKFIKNYTKNTVSRVNVSYSLGRKQQYVFANYLLTNNGLKDRVTMTSSRHIQLEYADIFDKMKKSEELKHVLTENLKETQKVVINGITFSTKLSIPVKQSRKLVLLNIVKIVYTTDKISGIYLICEENNDIIYNNSYGCYEVNSSSGGTFKLISATTALKEHQYPVSMHVMGDNKLRFRTKTF